MMPSIQQSFRRPFHLLVCLACLGIAQTSAMAQSSPPASLPPAAQEAVNKGIVAAKMPDYLLAIRFFEDARKLAPDAPVIYLNLGLAEARIPGRELRAIAWFGAYLAAYPDAPNAAEVKDQIAVLDEKNQSNVSKLIKSVQDAAGQTPDYRSPHLIDVTQLWLKAGDIAAALRTTDLVQDESPRAAAPYKSIALWHVASTQAEAGDVAGATKTANLIQDAKWKSKAQFAIGQSKIKSGDFVGVQDILAAALTSALKAVDLIEHDDNAKKSVLWETALDQAKAKDIAGALKTADLIQDDADYKNKLLAYIASESTPDIKNPIQPRIEVSNWLYLLDKDGVNTAPFLDLTGYLKSMTCEPYPPPAAVRALGAAAAETIYGKSRSSDYCRTDPTEMFSFLSGTALKIVRAQNIIHQMLKHQAQQPVKP